ncbi:MAG: inverse autotransporter beta domain-containing protein [Deltaproteobacteria bacterium]|nr:inverse autotransporter beta domain-containing protein [Deltaproteobacteria bacterium]
MEIRVLGQAVSGRYRNLDLAFARGGMSLPAGSVVSMIPSSDWPNLRPGTRRLVYGGRLRLQGLLAASGPGMVPLEAELPGGVRLRTDVRVAEAYSMSVALRHAGDGTFDADVAVMKDGRPYGGAPVRFLACPEISGLGPRARKADSGGTVRISGLRILGAGAVLKAAVDGWHRVEAPLFPGEGEAYGGPGGSGSDAPAAAESVVRGRAVRGLGVGEDWSGNWDEGSRTGDDVSGNWDDEFRTEEDVSGNGDDESLTVDDGSGNGDDESRTGDDGSGNGEAGPCGEGLVPDGPGADGWEAYAYMDGEGCGSPGDEETFLALKAGGGGRAGPSRGTAERVVGSPDARGDSRRAARRPYGGGGAHTMAGSAGRDASLEDRVLEMAASAGSDPFADAVLGWLSRYGKARLELGAGPGGVTGAIDFLYPFFDGEKLTLFGQAGARTARDGRSLANFGLGARMFPGGGQGLGANAFLDWDLGRGHGRAGVGAEYWREFFSLHANAYWPVTGWKISEDYAGAVERPASGWDLTARGYPLSDDRLTLSAGYESWKGSSVFGRGLYDDPANPTKRRGSWVWGARFMPLPGLSLNMDYRDGAEKGFSGSLVYTVTLDGTGGAGGSSQSSFLSPSPSWSLASSPSSSPLSSSSMSSSNLSSSSSNPSSSSSNPSSSGPAGLSGSGSVSGSGNGSGSGPGSGSGTESGSGTGLGTGTGSGSVSGPGSGSGPGSVSGSWYGSGSGGGSGFDPRSRRHDFVQRRYDMPLEYRARARYVIRLVRCGDGVCRFRVTNSLGVAWGHLAVGARAVTDGFAAADPSTGSPSGSFTTDGDGYFEVLLLPEPGVAEGTLRVSAGDAEADFRVVFGEESGTYGRIRVIYVGREAANVHVFRVIGPDGGGVAGHRVGFTVGTGIPVVDPGSGKPREFFSSDPAGYIRIGIASADPGERECVVTADPDGGDPEDFPVELAYVLELSAEPLELPYPESRKVVFTPRANGAGLAPGTLVRFVSEGADADFEGLPELAETDADGKIEAVLKPLKEGELAPVSVVSGGERSNAVTFRAVAGGPLVLAADRESLGYLSPRRTVFTLRLNGGELPEGTGVTFEPGSPSGFRGLPSGAVTGPGGAVAAEALEAAVPSGPLTVRARAGERVSGPVEFAVDLDGQLELSASREDLELGRTVEVVLTLRYRGEPLPEGTEAGFVFVPSDLAGLPSTAAVSAGGTVTVLLEARSSGTITVSAELGGLGSNRVDFAADAAGDLGLSAGRDALEFLEPTPAVFTVSRGGVPLPEGSAVTLVPLEPATLAGLDGSFTTGPGGSFTVSGLTALKPRGPLRVRASAGGLESGPVGFGVDLNGDLSLAASRESLELGVPVPVTLTLRYGGKQLPAGTETGFLFREDELSGLPFRAATAAGGTVAADLEALVPRPVALSASLGTLVSNAVEFSVDASGPLTVAADRDSLEFTVPETVRFTVGAGGVPLPAGVRVTLAAEDPGRLAGLGGEWTTSEGGVIAVPSVTALWPEGPLAVTARALDLESGPAVFGVRLEGTLGLAASRDVLGLFEARETELGLTYRGAALPAGVPVSFLFDPSELGGLEASAAAGPGGTVAAALSALVPAGPVRLAAALGTLESAPVGFGVEMKGTLGLTATRDTLELFAPRFTELAVTLNGVPLPSGTAVAFSFGSDELEGLPASAETGPGGKVAASLAALTAGEPVLVAASAGGLDSNPVGFGVEMLAEHLGMDWILDPATPYHSGDIVEEYAMFPCESYRGSFSFAYRGKALGGTSMSLRGTGLPPGGVSFVTDQSGSASFPVGYTDPSDEKYMADPWWHLDAGSSSMLVRGPIPTYFHPCL